MRLSIVAVLVLFAVLAADTEASWVKSTLRQVGKFTKETIRSQGVKMVTNTVKNMGPAMIGHVLGKRSVNLPFLGSISDQKAREMINALDLACTSFTGSKGDRALSAADVQAAFGASDGNSDSSLTMDEFNLFENSIEAVKHCWEVLKMQGK